LYEQALREIAVNLNYVSAIGGFRVSNKAGTAINEWSALSTPTGHGMFGVFVSDNVVYVGDGTASGGFSTQTAFAVRRFTLDGTLLGVTTIPFGPGAGKLQGGTELCVDSSGVIHIMDGVNGDIRAFDVDGNHVVTYGSGYATSACLSYNPANDRVYAGTGTGVMSVYTPAGVLIASRSSYTLDNGGAAMGLASVSFAVSGNTVWMGSVTKNIWIYDAGLSAAYISTFTGLSASGGNGDIVGNSRMVVDFANQVYFGTSQDKIVRCDLNGTFQSAFAGNGSGLGLFSLVGHVHVLTNGQILVGDVVDKTVTRFHQSIVFLDVHFCPLRKYSATNECSVGPISRIVPWGFNADGVLAPTPGVMNVPIPRTILGSGRYQAPLHVLVLRDLRQCCDEIADSEQMVHPGTLRTIKRDWATVDDLYYSAIGHDSELREAVQGSKQYSWQRTLGRIAALRPNPADFIELKLMTEYLRKSAQAMVGRA